MDRIILLTTLASWKEEADSLMKQNINEERYGTANYYSGKLQAYRDVIDLLWEIKEHNIPFELI